MVHVHIFSEHVNNTSYKNQKQIIICHKDPSPIKNPVRIKMYPNTHIIKVMKIKFYD